MEGGLLLSYVSGFSILLAGIIGVLKFKALSNIYRPFVYFCCLAFINEVVSFLMVNSSRSNTVNNNIYVLVELAVILWLFKSWNIYNNKGTKYVATFVLLAVIWCLDNLIFHSLRNYSSFYHVCYYLVLAFFSIDHINYVVVSEKRKVLKNPMFIICSAFLVYFSFNAFLEIFFALNINLSDNSTLIILLIMRLVNLFINLIYAWALICIPTKPKLSLLLSQDR